jgi:hypothetical protein
MNWTRSFLGLYLLRCSSCGRSTLRPGYRRAMSTCWNHDDHCPVQAGERLSFAEASAKPDPVPAGAVVGRYPTAGGAHVTVTAAGPDAETGAPGWVATCGGCGWAEDQYACWHELWPTFPNIAGGDIRGLLLGNAQEHADVCGTEAAR